MAKILEIEFKGSRKAFYANPQDFPFNVGDLVIVQADKGKDLGRVVNMGSLVDQRAGHQQLLEIVRKPGREDLEQVNENHQLEQDAFMDCRKRIEEHGLDMKLVDVEYQFDRNKITFYFTSDARVDFRELVRDLASRYRTRIELRQIGVRDEAKRIGGVGVCGRRLCCTTFLREFAPVVTQYAKEQNLALNPTKLSGVCGRLICCLRYERDFYREVIKRFPETETVVKTSKGKGLLKKIDVFQEKVVIEYANQEEERIGLDELNTLLSASKTKKKKKKKKTGKGKKREGHQQDEPQKDSGH
ncbi:stage 0 sporulation family protein [bacterium]|nr:stage 0 sporulation family protein [bacterium]